MDDFVEYTRMFCSFKMAKNIVNMIPKEIGRVSKCYDFCDKIAYHKNLGAKSKKMVVFVLQDHPLFGCMHASSPCIVLSFCLKSHDLCPHSKVAVAVSEGGYKADRARKR